MEDEFDYENYLEREIDRLSDSDSELDTSFDVIFPNITSPETDDDNIELLDLQNSKFLVDNNYDDCNSICGVTEIDDTNDYSSLFSTSPVYAFEAYENLQQNSQVIELMNEILDTIVLTCQTSKINYGRSNVYDHTAIITPKIVNESSNIMIDNPPVISNTPKLTSDILNIINDDKSIINTSNIIANTPIITTDIQNSTTNTPNSITDRKLNIPQSLKVSNTTDSLSMINENSHGNEKEIVLSSEMEVSIVDSLFQFKPVPLKVIESTPLGVETTDPIPKKGFMQQITDTIVQSISRVDTNSESNFMSNLFISNKNKRANRQLKRQVDTFKQIQTIASVIKYKY